MPAAGKFPDLIATQPELDALCQAIAAEAVLGLDTEFVRTNTYAPQLGLLQLKVNSEAICVDPLADIDLDELWTLLNAPERTSILHAAKQDLEVLWFTHGGMIHSIIDTQVCAGLLGHAAQIGYAGLVETRLGVKLPKGQTRTDWTRRPLSDAQLTYAQDDVEYLHQLHQELCEELMTADRYAWAQEDSTALCDVKLYDPDPPNAWQRIKSIPFLPGKIQARARELAAWRERRAFERNKPRQWIMDDKALLAISHQNPTHVDQLMRLDEVPTTLAQRQGERLLATVEAANERFAADPDQFVQTFPDRERDKAQTKRMMQSVRAQAEELNIPAEVLASKRDVNALIRGQTNNRLCKGWRKSVIGDDLCKLLD